MEQELAERRKHKPRKLSASAAGHVGDDVLDECEQSFIAAQESVAKASKNYYADTGLMALLCRHDRVLWLASMNTPGERQHFALALLRKLGGELPRSWHIGVLYDIGCQLARSVEKWGLLQELAGRLTFGVSVFHAYGHQWACQIVFHPRKRDSFGLSDGEGCERFWSAIRHLIACLRVSGAIQFHRRLFVLDRQAAAMDSMSLWKVASWLKRRYLDGLQRRDEAEGIVALCGFSESDLAQEWDDQVRSHLAKQPRQSAKAGDKAIEDILLALGLIDDLKQQQKQDRAALRKSQKSSTSDEADIKARLEATQAKIDSTKSRVVELNAMLGTEQCRRLETMRGNEYICARVNARALRAKIRQGIVAHKFERRKLERAYRQQILQAKEHSQTKDLVHRRERTITAQIQKYNELVDKMGALARQGKKPTPRVPLPRKLDSKKIFKLDVDDDIWQEDPGLGPQGETSLPRWQTDVDMKRGIRALLEKRRCVEEMERVEAEVRALGMWWGNEDSRMRAIADDARCEWLRST
ncbi:hypothetical protein AURDEDRAFT_59670 [Auricularia subglabra TFB-10046 SS5]|nr:hypothetical protein AURDEDRAFT_59670 [Auricularia subglabra TFB-10046 SS5]